MADGDCDAWPGYYPKEKLKKLSQIRVLLKLDPTEAEKILEDSVQSKTESEVKVDAIGVEPTEDDMEVETKEDDSQEIIILDDDDISPDASQNTKGNFKYFSESINYKIGKLYIGFITFRYSKAFSFILF